MKGRFGQLESIRNGMFVCTYVGEGFLGHSVFSASMSCRSGEELKIDNLLFGSIFNILLSWDLISNIDGVEVGVVWAVWHCTM